MSDPIKKLRDDVLEHLIPGSANVVERNIRGEFSAFAKEWEAKEVWMYSGGISGAPIYVGSDAMPVQCRATRTTILRRRAPEPSLREAARQMVDAVESIASRWELTCACDALAAALAKED